MNVCMDALNEVSKVWLVAKMVHTLFLSILGNKVLEERMQKAAGRRHKKPRLGSQQQQPQQQPTTDSPPKTKFDDMSLGYAANLSGPQVSFERSRPQTPAATPSRDVANSGPGSGGPSNAIPGTSNISPTMRHHEPFLGTGTSRNTTRPPTPFNPHAIPQTPPDLYLVTRNSPTISQALWENFQPDQLFPESTNMAFSGGWAGINNQNLDPALQMPTMQGAGMTMGNGQQGQQQAQQGGQIPGKDIHMRGGMESDQGWPNPMSPEDTWSNGSFNGPSVPQTLNVEDW